MSCHDCEKYQNKEVPKKVIGSTGVVRYCPEDFAGSAFYRWKNANIEMNGCDKHLREIFDVLSDYQDSLKK